ncbi:MAG: hypothetical protein Q9170_005648 [Blastenia crenularia]
MAFGGKVHQNTITNPNGLCTLCHQITSESRVLDNIARRKDSDDQDSVQTTERWPFHASSEILQKSADAGCHFCSLLNLQSKPLHDVPLHLKLIDNVGQPEWMRYEIGIEQTADAVGTWLSLIDQEGVRNYYGDYPLSNRSWRSISTASVATIELARGWINQCLSSHKECASQGVLPLVGPRRLLHIYWSCGEISVRLIECHAAAPALKYVTLSHCWGQSDVAKLTRGNYKTFTQNIPGELLPKTYKDAADITIRLGYNYLWIDSLCILQDSPEDFATEAASMGAIYANGVCRIAALDSKDSHGGCYKVRTPLAFYPCTVVTHSGHEISFHAPRSGGLRQQKRPDNTHEREHAILQTRGWTVQERMLASRTIYFSSIGIHWECCATEQSEQSGQLLGNLPHYNLHVSSIVRARSKVQSLDMSADDWADQWWRLVELYSGSDLTYNSDRWVAISGLANLFQIVTRSPLVHGLWQDRLHQELLWYTQIPGHRRLCNGAPSWSWTSIDGKVRNPQAFGSDRKMKAQILHVSVNRDHGSTPAVSDLTQEPPYITVRAQMREYQIRESPLEWYEDRLVRRHRDSITWSATEDFDDTVQDCLENGHWRPDVTNVELQSAIWALLWAYKPSNIVEGIVVRPLDHSQAGWYRIGSFCLGGQSMTKEVECSEGEIRTIDLY